MTTAVRTESSIVVNVVDNASAPMDSMEQSSTELAKSMAVLGFSFTKIGRRIVVFSSIIAATAGGLLLLQKVTKDSLKHFINYSAAMRQLELRNVLLGLAAGQAKIQMDAVSAAVGPRLAASLLVGVEAAGLAANAVDATLITEMTKLAHFMTTVFDVTFDESFAAIGPLADGSIEKFEALFGSIEVGTTEVEKADHAILAMTEKIKSIPHTIALAEEMRRFRSTLDPISIKIGKVKDEANSLMKLKVMKFVNDYIDRTTSSLAGTWDSIKRWNALLAEGEIWEAYKGLATDAFGWISKQAELAWANLGESSKGVMKSLVKNFFISTGDLTKIWTVWTDDAKEKMEVLGKVANFIWNKIPEDIRDSISGAVRATKDWVDSILFAITSKLQSWWMQLPKWMQKIFAMPRLHGAPMRTEGGGGPLDRQFGGPVPGVSGEAVPIMAHAGEHIFTGQQTSNLFAALADRQVVSSSQRPIVVQLVLNRKVIEEISLDAIFKESTRKAGMMSGSVAG